MSAVTNPGGDNPFEHTFESLLGLEILEHDEQRVTARVPVRRELKQGAGLVHGGVYASVAESLASAATYLAVASDGNAAMGLSNSTSFMRPITEGQIHALARRRHRGRTTWIWDVDFSDDQDRLCASTRVTIAVRPARPPS
ncbi:MAG TPA: PaaI family thioesterase [Solirubrobacteraceae bacterium]|nr:PaaI family thioesterase [Solirubrobacteraceae bacterium]